MKSDFIINHVVLVEDNVIILNDLKNMLVNSGLAKYVYAFTSGNCAIEFIKNNEHVDLLITDYVMNDGNGADVVNHVVQNPYAQGRILPILVISAHEEVKRIARKGIRVLTKPVTLRALRETIGEMVESQDIRLLKSSVGELKRILNNLTETLSEKGY